MARVSVSDMGGVAILLALVAFISTSFASSVYTYGHDGDVCVYAKMNVSFTVDYQSTDKDSGTTCITLPHANETRINGSCFNSTSPNDTSPTINIAFGMKFQHIFEMIFKIIDDQWLLSMCLEYDTSDTEYFMNASDPQPFNACRSDVLKVSVNHDYYCKYGQRVVINDNVTASFSFIDLYPLGKQQDQYNYCPSDEDHEHAKVVPIVVGSVLGLLLLIIFVVYSIAYLRQRNSIARSYEPLNNS